MFARATRHKTPVGVIRSVAPDKIRGQGMSANDKPRKGLKKLYPVSQLLKTIVTPLLGRAIQNFYSKPTVARVSCSQGISIP